MNRRNFCLLILTIFGIRNKPQTVQPKKIVWETTNSKLYPVNFVRENYPITNPCSEIFLPNSYVMRPLKIDLRTENETL